MRNFTTFSLPLLVPRIAVLGLILYQDRSLFISKVRFLQFCATYCIARWSKCDHVLRGNFRNTSVSNADIVRKLNHASYENRIMFCVFLLSSKEPAIRRPFIVLYVAVKGTADEEFFKDFGRLF